MAPVDGRAVSVWDVRSARKLWDGSSESGGFDVVWSPTARRSSRAVSNWMRGTPPAATTLHGVPACRDRGPGVQPERRAPGRRRLPRTARVGLLPERDAGAFGPAQRRREHLLRDVQAGWSRLAVGNGGYGGRDGHRRRDLGRVGDRRGERLMLFAEGPVAWSPSDDVIAYGRDALQSSAHSSSGRQTDSFRAIRSRAGTGPSRPTGGGSRGRASPVPPSSTWRRGGRCHSTDTPMGFGTWISAQTVSELRRCRRTTQPASGTLGPAGRN